MKKFLAIAFFLTSATIFAQGTVTGTVVDLETGSPLPGANVRVANTTTGTITDFDGRFSLEVVKATGAIRISFVGFEPKSVDYNVSNGETLDLGTIVLNADADALQEVVITGVADLAKDRETPVAVSTIRATEIQEKLGSQEFPEILNTTPSIYATKGGGGFGDARINIRGFDTRNSAVMINGVPINDMENGAVYWSNWAGLSDVASAIQVQRGLGSSKLAVSSVGGTINVLTRSAERAQGGFVSAGFGNDAYFKTVASYNTGLMDNGFSTSVLLSQTSGDGYVDGTEFQGYNYYLAMGWRPNDVHDFQFTVTGAPQWHNQRSFAPPIADYLAYGEGGEPDVKYNSDWGYLNGEEYSFRRNFYHKPIISLNWDYEISTATSLSSSFYASFGRGGGTGEIGRSAGARQYDSRWKTANGIVDVDRIVAYNSGETVNFAGNQVTRLPRPGYDGLFVNSNSDDRSEFNGISRRSSINSHNWYGVLSNLSHKLNENLTLDVGIDLRSYKGIHYRRLNDLLGGDAYLATADQNNPDRLLTKLYEPDPKFWVFSNIDEEEKIEYYNDGLVRWAGTFGQLEYVSDEISAFVQGSISNQGFKRVEYFNETPGNQESDWENIVGGNVKGGLNWNIDDTHNIYGNAGYYSKQPLFDAVWINFGNNLNPNLTNEIIIGTEIGYGFRSYGINANVNLYRTSWADRFESTSATFFRDEPNEIRGTANLQGIKQVHTGLEVDATARVTDNFRLRGMISVGNWEYAGDVTASYFDNNQDPIPGVDDAVLNLDGVKVGDAAQFTASIGADYDLFRNFSVDAGYRYADNLYAAFDATAALDDEEFSALELPSFGLLDLGASYKLPIGNNSVNFRVNVNNVLDEVYISEATYNNFASGENFYRGVDVEHNAYFGYGRTWNASVRYNF